MFDVTDTYRDVDYEIDYDLSPDDPRDWDNATNIVLYHNRYSLACETPVKSRTYNGWDELEAALRKEHDIAIMLPVYMYDHGGTAFYAGYHPSYPFNDRWDAGRVGFIFITRDQLKNCWGWQRVTSQREIKLVDYMRAELKTYESYCNGNVYCVDIEQFSESCCGFFSIESAKEFAESTIDYHLDRKNVI